MNTWSQTDGDFVLGCHVVLIWHILNMVHVFYSDKSLMSIKSRGAQPGQLYSRHPDTCLLIPFTFEISSISSLVSAIIV